VRVLDETKPTFRSCVRLFGGEDHGAAVLLRERNEVSGGREPSRSWPALVGPERRRALNPLTAPPSHVARAGARPAPVLGKAHEDADRRRGGARREADKRHVADRRYDRQRENNKGHVARFVKLTPKTSFP
jgi:hypothetical protein